MARPVRWEGWRKPAGAIRPLAALSLPNPGRRAGATGWWCAVPVGRGLAAISLAAAPFASAAGCPGAPRWSTLPRRVRQPGPGVGDPPGGRAGLLRHADETGAGRRRSRGGPDRRLNAARKGQRARALRQQRFLLPDTVSPSPLPVPLRVSADRRAGGEKELVGVGRCAAKTQGQPSLECDGRPCRSMFGAFLRFRPSVYAGASTLVFAGFPDEQVVELAHSQGLHQPPPGGR